jgi:membrane associated rhomboid family serine protease
MGPARGRGRASGAGSSEIEEVTYRSTWEAPEPDASGRVGRFLRTGPAVQLLVAVTCVVWVFQNLTQRWDFFSSWFGLSLDGLRSLKLWQPLTYVFLHAVRAWDHILINMLLLWVFGPEVEAALGRRGFLKAYFICGLGAALLHLPVSAIMGSSLPLVGASGAVLGIMVFCTLLSPNRIVMFLFVVPMKMKHLIWLLIGLDVLMILSMHPGDRNAHWAHLGGALTGFLLFRHPALLEGWGRGIDFGFRFGLRARWPRRRRRARGDDRHVREQVDRILEKIGREGMHALSRKERRFLKSASRTFQHRADGPP